MIDLRDPAFHEDPHAFFARLREEAPLHRDALGFVYILRHAEVFALLRDERIGKDFRRWEGYAVIRPFGEGSTIERYGEQWMLSRDPPDHTRLRRLAMLAFTPRAISAIREAIEAIAREILAGLPDDGEIELMSAFAQPFPVRVILRILGLPLDHYAQLKEWSDGLIVVGEPMIRRSQRQRADVAAKGLVDYFRQAIEAKRARRGEDLLSALLQAEEAGDRLSEEELIAMLLLLFVAGHETTSNLVGNGLFALLGHPQELARLRADRTLLPTAVEELLRWDGPVSFSSRAVREPVEIAGETIAAGQLVMLALAAANRDPRAFEAPDHLDVARDPNPHLGFGGGMHHCLGATLARLEGQIAFDQLFHRWRTIALAETAPRRRALVNIRGFDQLPLRVGQ
jgi:cytochrome P450